MAKTSKFAVIKQGSIFLAALAVVLAAGTYVQTVIRGDPFAGLKKTSKDVDPGVGVRIKNATVQTYKDGKLVAKAHVDRMDVSQDKNHYDMFGVHYGEFFSDKGSMKFEGTRANWNVPLNVLNASEGGHITDKASKLDVSPFQFNSSTGLVHVPGPVKGRLYDGDVNAMAIQYNINSGRFKTGKMNWVGKISNQGQIPDQTSDRVWDVSGEDSDNDGDVLTVHHGYATDHEIQVFADLIVYDRKTLIVNATGNVRYVSTKNIMVCEKAVVERKIRKATLTGNVQMLIRAQEKTLTFPDFRKEREPKFSDKESIPPYRPIVPDEIAKTRPAAPETGQSAEQKKIDDEVRSGKNIRDFDTICYADKVLYWYKKGERHAEISGNPQARQELHENAWRQVWTYMAYYDGEKDKLKLVSSPGNFDTRMVDSTADDGTCEWIEISTKDGEDKWHAAHMTGQFPDRSDDIPRTQKSKTTADKAPGTTGTTGTGTGTGTTGGGGGGQKPPPPKNKIKPNG